MKCARKTKEGADGWMRCEMGWMPVAWRNGLTRVMIGDSFTTQPLDDDARCSRIRESVREREREVRSRPSDPSQAHASSFLDSFNHTHTHTSTRLRVARVMRESMHSSLALAASLLCLPSFLHDVDGR